ncbi:hypothetical protein [uncultured Corynebacterium sp.]|uniref:hypothetical protein n=1 Tax=uncultured Corynebacterium sp. TaxID=159447 RepID=UPI00259344FF|nr:hypothetical protein [uncultured Corynebacterium sp.]
MATISDLAAQTATTIGIDKDAARDALTTYLHQMQALEARTIDPEDINADDAAFLVESVRQAQRSGDLGTRELAKLEDAAAAVSHAEDMVRDTTAERDKLIIAALRAGALVSDVTRAAGISRARVYQVKDNMKRA